jgi:hypothetical protein
MGAKVIVCVQHLTAIAKSLDAKEHEKQIEEIGNNLFVRIYGLEEGAERYKESRDA